MGKQKDIKKIVNIIEYVLGKAGSSHKITLDCSKNTSISTMLEIYECLNSYYGDYVFCEKIRGAEGVKELTFLKSSLESKLADLKATQDEYKRKRFVIVIVTPLVVFSLLTFVLGFGIGLNSGKKDEVAESYKELSVSFCDLAGAITNRDNSYNERLLVLESLMGNMVDSKYSGGENDDNNSDN